jgi:putative transposase
LVFTTKYRRGALTDPILTRRQQIMADVCADSDATLTDFNSETDHVHPLVHHPPAVALSKLVNSLNGVSSRHLPQEFAGHLRQHLWRGHLWSPSYLAASCGGAPLAVVKEYIDQQKRPT